MRVRLAFAVIAVLAAAAAAIWGFLPSAKTGASPSASVRNSASTNSVSSAANASPTPHVSASKQPSVSPTSGMHLVFDATFNGSTPDTHIWDTCYPWIHDPNIGCTNFGNGNYEVDWDLPSQVHVSGGALTLTARREPTVGYAENGYRKVYSCRSGMVTSYPGFSFKYGYIEVDAHIPGDPGLWSALWLAASNFHWPPEIDMVETFSAPKNETGMFFHPVGAKYVGVHLPLSYGVTAGWHRFAVDWTPSRVTWYYDGATMMSVSQDIPSQPMYLLMNLAAYSENGSGYSACNGSMEISSVRVWQ